MMNLMYIYHQVKFYFVQYIIGFYLHSFSFFSFIIFGEGIVISCILLFMIKFNLLNGMALEVSLMHFMGLLLTTLISPCFVSFYRIDITIGSIRLLLLLKYILY